MEQIISGGSVCFYGILAYLITDYAGSGNVFSFGDSDSVGVFRSVFLHFLDIRYFSVRLPATPSMNPLKAAMAADPRSVIIIFPE